MDQKPSEGSVLNFNESEKQQIVGSVFLATLFGAIIRCFFVFSSKFPLNDGGMFYTMVQDLQAASFKLPLFTTYNNANIPFTYPPLPFYLAGFLNSILKIDLINILRFLPLFFSILTIPAFYFVSRQLLQSKQQQILATFLFAVLPTGYTWQIMGGGLTRSMAFFFTFLALYYFIKLQKTNQVRDLIWTTVFTSLTILCHLEMAMMLAISFPLIYLYFNRSIKGLRNIGILIASVLVLTSIWWLTGLMQHGFSPFLAAFSNGGFNILSPFAYIISMNVFGNLNMNFILFLAIIGMFILIKNKNSFLPIWLLVFIFLDPRSNQRSGAIPLAMLASVSLELMFEWVKNNHPMKDEKKLAESSLTFLSHKKVQIIFLMIMFYYLFNNLYPFYSSGNLLVSLNQDNRDAMQWVKQNTPANSRFLVIDFPITWNSDLVGEWFPTLTLRTSVITAQGKEWLTGGEQVRSGMGLNSVSACRSYSAKCLEEWQTKSGLEYEYIYFTANSQFTTDGSRFTSPLETEMSLNSNYPLLYSNSDVRIYKNH
jgi:hypothetical protein